MFVRGEVARLPRSCQRARARVLGWHAGWLWVEALEAFRHHGTEVAAGEKFAWSENWLIRERQLSLLEAPCLASS